MKKLAFITLLIYVWALSKPLVLIVDYHINTDDITASFCVNTETPSLECNGQCYLKKKLDEDLNNDNKPIGNTTDKKQNKLDRSGEYDFLSVGPRLNERSFRVLGLDNFGYLASKSECFFDVDLPPPNA